MPARWPLKRSCSIARSLRWLGAIAAQPRRWWPNTHDDFRAACCDKNARAREPDSHKILRGSEGDRHVRHRAIIEPNEKPSLGRILAGALAGPTSDGAQRLRSSGRRRRLPRRKDLYRDCRWRSNGERRRCGQQTNRQWRFSRQTDRQWWLGRRQSVRRSARFELRCERILRVRRNGRVRRRRSNRCLHAQAASLSGHRGAGVRLRWPNLRQRVRGGCQGQLGDACRRMRPTHAGQHLRWPQTSCVRQVRVLQTTRSRPNAAPVIRPAPVRRSRTIATRCSRRSAVATT